MPTRVLQYLSRYEFDRITGLDVDLRAGRWITVPASLPHGDFGSSQSKQPNAPCFANTLFNCFDYSGASACTRLCPAAD